MQNRTRWIWRAICFSLVYDRGWKINKGKVLLIKITAAVCTDRAFRSNYSSAYKVLYTEGSSLIIQDHLDIFQRSTILPKKAFHLSTSMAIDTTSHARRCIEERDL
jgi:hypothetical protein